MKSAGDVAAAPDPGARATGSPEKTWQKRQWIFRDRRDITLVAFVASKPRVRANQTRAHTLFRDFLAKVHRRQSASLHQTLNSRPLQTAPCLGAVRGRAHDRGGRDGFSDGEYAGPDADRDRPGRRASTGKKFAARTPRMEPVSLAPGCAPNGWPIIEDSGGGGGAAGGGGRNDSAKPARMFGHPALCCCGKRWRRARSQPKPVCDLVPAPVILANGPISPMSHGARGNWTPFLIV